MSLDTPALNPPVCYSPQILRRFLSLSRTATDDAISSDLNSLPTSSTTKSVLVTGDKWAKPNRAKLGSRRRPECDAFVQNLVFASWKARDDVLDYCAAVAEQNQARFKQQIINSNKQQETENIPKLDPRIDPYRARELPVFSKEDEVLSWVGNERVIEDIVRDRSWSIICERCIDFGAEHEINEIVGDNGNGWKTAFGEWAKKRSS
ncbi:caffeine-induced death protein 2-domain-containing protein [Lipomyces japonicus]|uniref:caffeine-induced death protein 2-domain-containing protein n=1 Tax=Lipomyces japonicus TaxID=56871 RepID=UPI0034CDD9F6